MAGTNATSMFDPPTDATTEARFGAEAEADIAAGRPVPHDRVRAWPRRLAPGASAFRLQGS